ncbi:MAG: NAD(P)-dependent oxidoreductase [Bacilli bacterium]
MKVGFIGLGIMGMPMAINVSKKYSLIGYDIVLKEAPFPLSSSLEEVIKESDVVISMLPKNEHVQSVYCQALNYVKKGQIFIDMSTISPHVSSSLASQIENKGAYMCDCPVVKSQPAAVSGTLGIYVGGKKEVFEKIKDILSCMGSNIIYMGDNGSGLVMKLLHNSLVGQIQNGVNEVMSVASHLGIDLNDFVKAISYGGGQNFYMDGKAQNIINNEYKTAFSIANMHKDAHLMMDLLEENNLSYPGFSNTIEVYDKAMDMGLEKEDFSATYKVVNKR